jgi:hypothetical protein
MIPMKMAITPSMRKSHDHGARPVFSKLRRLSIPKAIRPPKLPERVAQEKKTAT